MPTGFESLKSQEVEDLIDVTQLTQWLDGLGLSEGAPIRVRRISGGMSNESIGIERGDERYVLRRPAKLALDQADRGMRREYRLLCALESTNVPHPRPVALCEDPKVTGGIAYLMEHVDGFAPGLEMPEPFASDKRLRRDIALEAMEALGRLARVDWRAIGLEDFGRPDGFHERQVDRWSAQLARYGDDPTRDLSGAREVGDWLEANRPGDADWTPGIMHGDYHLANLFVASRPPVRVAAILDWENATIGDPALDLATFIRLAESRGRKDWADREAMVARWEAASGRAAPDLRYGLAHSAFKLSIMVEGIYRRSLADPTRGSSTKMGETAIELMEEARTIVRA